MQHSSIQPPVHGPQGQVVTAVARGYIPNSNSYDGDNAVITATVASSRCDFSDTLLPATSLTTAEAAAPVASGCKVSWKSFSEAWPGDQRSNPTKVPYATDSLHDIPFSSCTEPWLMLQRLLVARFVSCLQLCCSFPDMQPITLPIRFTYNSHPFYRQCEYRLPTVASSSPFFTWPLTGAPLLLCAARSRCPETNLSWRLQGHRPPFSHVNHPHSQTSSGTLSQKCPRWFLYHVPQQALTLKLILPLYHLPPLSSPGREVRRWGGGRARTAMAISTWQHPFTRIPRRAP